MAIQARTFSLFPTAFLPRLGRMRGRRWMRLVERVAELPETHPEYMAYTLMMRRLAAQVEMGLCVEPGCVTCALEILECYEGSERDLLDAYHATLGEVQRFVAGIEQVQVRAA